jgi:predicted ester cyclase
MFEEVWNQRLFNLVPRYCDTKVVCHSVRMRRVQGIDPYQIELVNLLATFPDGRVEVRDIAVLDGPENGLRVAVVWLLRGTYCGVPTYGPPTRTPVNVLGASHFELRDGKVLREWRIFDEIAVLAQIHAGREQPPPGRKPHPAPSAAPSRLNGARSMRLAPASSRSATASPRAAECLKPWPEQAETTVTRSRPGARSTRNREPGTTV